MRSIRSLIAALNTILFEQWDPIGVASMDGWPRDEFESYVPHIITLLEGSSSDDDIAQHLGSLESRFVGVTPSSLQHRLSVVAQLRAALADHRKLSREELDAT